MQAALKLKAPILPGKRIEFTAPELPESGEVELIVVLPENAVPAPEEQAKPQGVWDYIQSLPPGPRSAATWEEIERNFQEERNSWDR
ncbi:MAG TPA: hypothetical protein VFB21_01680 [Chthonomonadaceae bacterium]|nr:hypothetical protein [Chthonomonadaceae bacterium]